MPKLLPVLEGHHHCRAVRVCFVVQSRMGAFTVLFVVFSALLVCAAVLGIENAVRSILWRMQTGTGMVLYILRCFEIV